MRYLANHRRDIPPIGYFINAEIQQHGNLYHAMVEPVEFANHKQIEWNENLIVEDAGKLITFIKRYADTSSIMRISVDKNNFSDFDSCNEVGRKLTNLYDEPISLEVHSRKNLLPDPQVVITLAGYYSIFYPLLKPFLAKVGEKIAEDIADDFYKVCKSKAKSLANKLVESIRIIRKDIVPTNKVLLTIFEIPGEPYIELQIKSDDPVKTIKAISDKKLFKVHEQVKSLQKKIAISEIYFIFNAKDKWEFSYLISENGEVIGTKSSFKKRDKLISRINLSPTKAFSLGAEGVKYEKRLIKS